MRYIAKDGLKLLVKIKFGSAAKLAGHLGYSAKAIQQIIAKKKQPRYTTVLDISNALNYDVDFLFDKIIKPSLYARKTFDDVFYCSGYSRSEFCSLLNIPINSLKMIKSGKSRVSQERANIISKALGLPVDDLFEWRYED